MKRKIVVATLLLGTLLSAGVGLALAESDSWGGGYGRNGNCADSAEDHAKRLEHRMAMMAEVLDLSEQQQAQIKQMLTSNYAQHQALREQLQKNRTALREQLQADSFDEQSFRSLAGKQAELKTELIVARARMKQQLNTVLTPEQQEKAKRLWQLRGKEHHGRHGIDL